MASSMGQRKSPVWSEQDDRTLIDCRARGLNWAQIQQTQFPNKTGNACRKRHERLMEKVVDDWDNQRFEQLAHEYLSLRKEIWAPLAARTGEKWQVVESKCLEKGLKNIQAAGRSANRRAQLASPTDDSGIGGLASDPISGPVA